MVGGHGSGASMGLVWGLVWGPGMGAWSEHDAVVMIRWSCYGGHDT